MARDRVDSWAGASTEEELIVDWVKYFDRIRDLRHDLLCEEESDELGEEQTQHYLLALAALEQAECFLKLVKVRS